jgi:catechol 2,3-dioxygenase-like lactoylglutathione lyase family enzyme
MTQSITCLSLVVPDYDEAIAHYTQDLGFDLVEDTALPNGQRWVLVAPPGSCETRLLLARASNDTQAQRVGDQTGGRVFLFLRTDDFQRDHAALTARGVQFLESPRKESYGTVAVFKDKFGNLWDLLQPVAMGPRARRGGAGWRAATIGCLLLMAIATAAGMSMFEQFKAQMAHLQIQLKNVPQIHSLAVLSDSQQAPAMLVTLDPGEGVLRLQRLNAVKEGRDDSLHVWTLGTNGQPVLLGVIVGKVKTLQMPVDPKALQGVSRLAVSVESKSKVEQVVTPALPYLWTGAWVQKAL